ncbi:ABC transporter ATP-binding protein [Schaalia sp. ZJ405]|uniref:ATP-binding cassette domain-containing protein n=1 Tax=Schaalia sp. ZJ405 TaxID=2709403 RepID=UPI0013EB7C30|nr:ABC transporter ATP-binding protein [Schaalia sp. ZJ405]QPK81021.1 ABC transporter ATP-binding protein [Schaalia sp. ZJ405]
MSTRNTSGTAPGSSRKRPKTPLHPRVTSAVARKDTYLQVAYRWSSVLAASLAAVWIGSGVDTARGGGVLAPQWWVMTFLWSGLAAVMSACAVSHSLTTQAQTEREFRRLTQDAWFALGPTRLKDRSGRMLDLATNGAMRAARYRGGFLSATLASFSSPIIVCLVIGFAVSWVAAGLMVLLVVVGPLLMEVFNKSTRAAGRSFRGSQTFLRQSFLQGIGALESLIYAGAGKAYAKDLARENEIHRRTIMRLLAGNQSLIFFMDIIFSMVAVLLATFLGASGVNAGTLTPGRALSLLILTMILVAPVDLIGQFFYIGIGGRATQNQLSALAREVDAVTEASHRARSTSSSPMPLSQHKGDEDEAEPALSFTDVTVGWPKGPTLIEHVTWHVNAGERVALIGPSGIGKSTVSAVIQGYLEPRSGQVRVLGHDVDYASGASIRRDLAVVEQRTYLFNGSIADNLRMVAPDAGDDELIEALTQANLADEIRSFPDGLNTQVGDHGARLSGGQAQRLAIARAFLKRSPILLLDEPTSQVDLTGEALIVQALERISRQRTVLMIAHRRAAIDNVDRVLVVGDKKVEERQ